MSHANNLIVPLHNSLQGLIEMRAKKITPIHSPGFVELFTLFHSFQRPYTLTDILQFNRTYQPIYRQLGPEEKRRCEELVDAMVDGVENRELASRIFGVV